MKSIYVIRHLNHLNPKIFEDMGKKTKPAVFVSNGWKFKFTPGGPYGGGKVGL